MANQPYQYHHDLSAAGNYNRRAAVSVCIVVTLMYLSKVLGKTNYKTMNLNR